MDNMRPEDVAARARLNEAAAEVERDAAVDVAATEAVHADYANAQAVDATIEANRARAAAAELATDRGVLRNELAYERAASESNAFGFYLTLGILVAGLLVTGIYLYWRNSTPDSVNVYAASPTATAPANPPVIVTPAPSAVPAVAPPPVVNVTPPAQQPPVVNVNPTTPPAPDVHNDIHINPPGGSGDTGGTGSGTGAGTGTDSGTSGTSGTGGG